MDKKAIDKEAIIAEYLTGNLSCRKAEIKYGIDFRLIHSWGMNYQGKKRKTVSQPKEEQEKGVPLSNEVKQLQQ